MLQNINLVFDTVSRHDVLKTILTSIERSVWRGTGMEEYA